MLLIEADRIAEHATGRNGGFCEASLTHGEANGHDLGRELFAGMRKNVVSAEEGACTWL